MKLLFYIFYILIFISINNCFDLYDQPSNQCEKNYPGMQCIPTGEFIRGSDENDADERPKKKIHVSEFYIDIYEVTNDDFQKCLQAGKCKDCLKTGKCDFIGPRYGKPYMNPKQPIVGVSWYTAKEYCEFVGKRLPTEAEWEKAARGTDGDIYPWGNEPADCSKAVILDKKKGCGTDKDLPTSDVGTKPPGKYGLYDMAGNSWEWVNDWYIPYEKCGDECAGNDPKGVCNGAETCSRAKTKVLKGGSWWWDKSYARASKRRHHDPKNFPEYHHFGFRCAKD